MPLDLNVSLGDVIVAASTVGSIFIAYQAVKGQIATFSQTLAGLTPTVQKHESRLDQHDRLHSTHTTKIAGLEGRVFGRRIDDVSHEPAWEDR